MPQTLIIGATGGIGSAVVAELRSRFWQLHLAARDQTRLGALAVDGEVCAPCDARDRGSLEPVVAPAAAAAGDQPLGVVLAVGSILIKPAHRTGEAEFAETIAHNLTTAFNLVAAVGATCRAA